MAHITINTNSSSLYEYIKPYIETLEQYVNTRNVNKLYEKVKVFINGSWIGVAKDPVDLYESMKHKKYSGIINIYTSIVFDIKNLEIRICNDAGRLTRPVLRVKNNRVLMTQEIVEQLESKELSWNDILTSCKLENSIIEYIDPEEQNYAMIAMKVKNDYLQDARLKFNYTHCEIHPSTIFGVLVNVL